MSPDYKPLLVAPADALLLLPVIDVSEVREELAEMASNKACDLQGLSEDMDDSQNPCALYVTPKKV